ncbi:MAG: LacI family DNA-binding transcriptional regulator [Victivallaceae bacterium]|nr:LacI family DNA-binding transcriptional regulator [Victivallaceae bacterium]
MKKAMVKVDIEYIAMKLGMAKSTVSKALNGRPDVSEKTRERVRKFARKLNYTPDRFAQALKMKKSNLIGVVMHEMRHDFFVEITRGITSEAQRNGYQAVFASSEGSKTNEAAIIDDFISRYIDGLIIIPCIGEDASHLEELAAEGHPCVIVDNYIEGLDIPFVGTDFEEGGYIAAKFLLENGHKHISFLLGRPELSSTPERLAGYKQALAEAGIAFRTQYVRYGNYSVESGQSNAEILLRGFPEIDAILCANTDLSEGAAKAVFKAGKNIPKDISLMDFGGSRFTVVNQKNEEIGKTAVETLFNIFNREEIPAKIIIKPEIVARNSVRLKL